MFDQGDIADQNEFNCEGNISKSKINTLVQNFTVPDFNGSNISLADFRRKKRGILLFIRNLHPIYDTLFIV